MLGDWAQQGLSGTTHGYYIEDVDRGSSDQGQYGGETTCWEERRGVVKQYLRYQAEEGSDPLHSVFTMREDEHRLHLGGTSF
jgi:hypothetical protein